MKLANVNYDTLSEENFDGIADTVLNKTYLLINGEAKFRIAEIEFYLFSPKNHPDQYVHCHTDQLTCNKFYFHKHKTGTYKNGTFKGVDITLGDVKSKTYFGILIRAIYDMKNENMIEGPCKCVNKILELCSMESINELTGGQMLDIFQNEKLRLIKFKYDGSDKETIMVGPRIGLSNKYPDYRNRHYRYVISSHAIKKERKSLVVKIIDSEQDVTRKPKSSARVKDSRNLKDSEDLEDSHHIHTQALSKNKKVYTLKNK